MIEQLQVLVVTFASVFLKGFQHKNVIGNHKKSVFITSYAMAVCDVLFIGLIAKQGWSVCFAAGTGAALAMVSSIWLHDKLLRKSDANSEVVMGNRDKQRKEQKKPKKDPAKK